MWCHCITLYPHLKYIFYIPRISIQCNWSSVVPVSMVKRQFKTLSPLRNFYLKHWKFYFFQVHDILLSLNFHDNTYFDPTSLFTVICLQRWNMGCGWSTYTKIAENKFGQFHDKGCLWCFNFTLWRNTTLQPDPRVTSFKYSIFGSLVCLYTCCWHTQ